MNKSISEQVLDWYDKNKRDLPWRNTKNPYYIWISEIMLQQTRVETVKGYYYRFIEALPTVEDLANASEDKLLKLWQGLGYYSRVKNMQKAAIQCVNEFQGSIPTTYDELLTLSGIGPYSAGAIASIAFNRQVAAIDGNLMRVYSRLHEIDSDIMLSRTKKEIEQKIYLDVNERMGDFNQALMDIGSSICIANGTVRCNICPIQSHCKAYQNGSVYKLPIKNKKIIKKKQQISQIIYHCDGKILIEKRPDTGLLSGLYQFVTLEQHVLKKELEDVEYLGKYKHVFSHVVWDIKAFLVTSKNHFEKDNHIWVSIEEIEKVYSIPTAFMPAYKDALERVI